MSETCFQNTKTTLKNQQVSIQGLETQIGQLAKLISKRPQVAYRVTLNLTQESSSMRLPFKMRKALSQMPNAVKFLNKLLVNKRKLDEAPHVELNAKRGSKSAHEHYSSNKKRPIYEERRLRVEELDEWQTHKPKLRLNELNIPPNQLKVGDKVLLDATNPRIAISKSNREIPLTVLNIFPYGVGEANEVEHGRVTRLCASTRLKHTGMGRISDAPKFKIVKHRAKITRPCSPIPV
ncbi:hypothetical protein GOBAR_AA31547 [Gossypium barbadense]|uniref:Uncharacterized protein n=1 Tax=Gossypium barbadense TaxID=3634 RepID=A0A2P5WDK9_GOSBA|nr:hypothetical protein GOBAR_AA31547 [Gossypium barbadense]